MFPAGTLKDQVDASPRRVRAAAQGRQGNELRGAAGDYRPAARRAGRRPGAAALLEREAGEGRGRGAVIGTSATAAVMKAAGSRLATRSSTLTPWRSQLARKSSRRASVSERGLRDRPAGFPDWPFLNWACTGGLHSRPWRGQISFCCVKAWISSTASSTRCRGSSRPGSEFHRHASCGSWWAAAATLILSSRMTGCAARCRVACHWGSRYHRYLHQE